MTADSSYPLTERERRTLDALAVGLAHSDPAFVTTMRTGRARGAGRTARRDRAGGARLLGFLLARAVLLLSACVLAAAVSIGALLLGPVAVLALGPVALVVVGCLAVHRTRRGPAGRGRS